MRWSLRREPRGRHALGAAVTAIPTAPPRPAPVIVPPADAWASRSTSASAETVPTVVRPVPVTPARTPQMPVSPAVGAVAEPPPVLTPLPVLPVQPLDLDPALLDLAGGLPSQPVQAPPAALPVPPLPVPSPVPAPTPSPVVQALPPVGTGPRVELGFADGTFRTLDPSSSAAQALSDLVGELTGKGERPSASAS